MNIATFVFNRSLQSAGARRRFWRLARKVLIRLYGDPVCCMNVHGRKLKLPLSHELPTYLNECPFYDSLPGRIADFLRAREGRINCIDVGANVGDTIAALNGHENDTFLAIEPSPGFRRLLIENWRLNKNVTVVPHMVSDGADEGGYVFRERSGTASIVRAAEGTSLTAKSLDSIVKEHPSAEECNFLKIDTDGHDLKVLAGAQRLIADRLPVILFECDDFGSATYVEECLGVLEELHRCGYRHFLAYSNTGCLMGWHSLDDLAHFRNLLFYQLTGDFCYFDLLLMRPEYFKEFYRAELDFFAEKLSDKPMRTMALNAAAPID